MKLSDISLSKLLPIFMRREKDTVALADALTPPLVKFAEECRKLSTFDALELLSEEELDALALELNVLWYDTAFPITTKRAVLAQSDLVWMRLGSRAAVQMVLRQVYGVGEVQEFWEYYQGKPHYFRINILNNADVMTDENEAKFLRLLDLVKRKSQWLEGIVAEFRIPLWAKIGVSLSYRAQYRILVDTYQDNPSLPLIGSAASDQDRLAETTHDQQPS